MKVHGILQQHIVHHYPIGHLDIIKGETSKSAIKIFKEYIANKLDLKFYMLKDKKTNKIRTRLLHFNNGKVTYRKENRG